MTTLTPGWFLELIPRDPPPVRTGIVLVGVIFQVDPPNFALTVDYAQPEDREVLEWFRSDSGELAVRISDGSLWEIGRTMPPRWRQSS